MLLRAFQNQVLLQCEFMTLATAEVNAAMQSQDTTRIFYGLQNLLNAAANISKVLWGSGGRHADERREVRDSIGIHENSPLSTVTMRNNFEHFDERLDGWWSASARHNSQDLCVMPKSSVTGIDPIDWFRVFDPITTDLYFWSQEFNIQDLVNEVQRILPKLREEANKPHWETGPKKPKG